MTKPTIVAIGGTGTHAAISFLRLAILSNMELKDIPNIVVVDADTLAGGSQSSKATPSLLTTAKNLYSQLVDGIKDESRPFFKNFTPFVEKTQQQQNVQAETSFGDYLIGQSVSTASSTERKILDALYTRAGKIGTYVRDEKSEQEILIADGFYARPSVGASTIYDLLNQPQSDLKKLLIGQLKGNAPSIVVVGSSTGGTGSGGAPAVAQWLMREKTENQSRTHVGLFMSLPWFSPVDSVDPTKDRSYGTKEAQSINSSAGIRLYAESNTLKKAGVFLADFDGLEQKRLDSGNKGQPEVPHVFNLMMASQIQNFFLAAANGVDETTRGVQGTYTFYHLDKTPQERLLIDASDSPLTAFSEKQGSRQDIQQWAIETQSIRVVLDKLADYIGWNYAIGPKAEPQNREEPFARLMLKLAEALGKNNVEEKGGIPFLKIGVRTVEIQRVRDELAKALRERAKELAETIAWLDDVKLNSAVDDKPTFKISASAVMRTLPADACREYPIFEKGKDPFPTVLAVFNSAFNEAKTQETGARATDALAKFDELIDPQKGALWPATAAAAVVELQIRACIRARFGDAAIRANDNLLPVVGSGAVRALVPMRVANNADIVNHYLIELNLDRLIDSGSHRNGQEKAVADPTHPFTVTGLTSAAIPSPWASARLQGWIQIHGDELQKLQARNCFEAIAWGCFSKRLKLENLPLKGTRLGDLLTTSLRAELGSEQLEKLNSLLVATDANNPNDVIGINHPKTGWYLAPWLLELTKHEQTPWWELPYFSFALPSANVAGLADSDFLKRKYRAFYDYLKNSVNVNHEPDALARTQVPWSESVKNILLQIEPHVVNTIAAPTIVSPSHQLRLWGRKNGELAISLCSVSLLEKTLEDIVKQYVPSFLVAIDNGDDFLLPNYPVFSRFLGQVTSCERIGKLEALSDDSPRRKLGITHTLQYRVSIGELGETLLTLDTKVESLGTHVALWPNFVEKDWKYYYLGCAPGKTIQEDDDLRFSVLNANGDPIGPHGRTFRTNHELFGVPRYISIETADGGTLVERGLFDIKLEEILGCDLQFNMGLDIGTSHSCVYPVDTGGNKIPGIDFIDAANALTCDVFLQNDQKKLMQDTLLFLGPYSSASKVLRVGGFIEDGLVIPTELRVQSRKGVEISADMVFESEFNREPGKNFSTTPLQFKSAKTAAQKGDEILTDYKWPRLAGGISGDADEFSPKHGLTGTHFEDHQKEVLSVYVLQMLRITLGTLRYKKYKTLKMLRPTYPEAFDAEHVQNYADQLVVIFQKLAETTGIAIELTSPLTTDSLLRLKEKTHGAQPVAPFDSFMVSESLAAVGAGDSPVAGPLHEVGVCLVLDMGGGTTDVALYATEQGRDDDLIVESISDSVRYAGNDVLALLATDQVLKVMLEAAVKMKINPEAIKDLEDPAFRLRTLKRLMRNGDAVGELRMKFGGADFAPGISAAVTLFFSGLIEYARLMLKPYQHKFDNQGKAWTVSVILLGNGWRLSDLVWREGRQIGGGFIGEIKSELGKALGDNVKINAQYSTSGQVSVKESIAMGAVRFQPQRRNVADMNPLLSVPGFPLRVEDLNGVTSISAGAFLPMSSKPDQIVAIEIEDISALSAVVRQQLGKALEETDARLDDKVRRIMNSHISQYLGQRITSNYPVRVSPLALFLEGVWKYAVRGVARAKGR